MVFSFIPIVDTQYPTDHIPERSQTIFPMKGNLRLRSAPEVFLIYPMTDATAILGGITVTMCMPSGWTLISITSISPSRPSMCLSSSSAYARTPWSRKSLRRYRGVETSVILRLIRCVSTFPEAHSALMVSCPSGSGSSPGQELAIVWPLKTL